MKGKLDKYYGDSAQSILLVKKWFTEIYKITLRGFLIK